MNTLQNVAVKREWKFLYCSLRAAIFNIFLFTVAVWQHCVEYMCQSLCMCTFNINKSFFTPKPQLFHLFVFLDLPVSFSFSSSVALKSFSSYFSLQINILNLYVSFGPFSSFLARVHCKKKEAGFALVIQ